MSDLKIAEMHTLGARIEEHMLGKWTFKLAFHDVAQLLFVPGYQKQNKFLGSEIFSFSESRNNNQCVVKWEEVWGRVKDRPEGVGKEEWMKKGWVTENLWAYIVLNKDHMLPCFSESDFTG